MLEELLDRFSIGAEDDDVVLLEEGEFTELLDSELEDFAELDEWMLELDCFVIEELDWFLEEELDWTLFEELNFSSDELEDSSLMLFSMQRTESLKFFG